VRVHFNDRVSARATDEPVTDRPLQFHRRLPGYAPTPLHELPSIAERLHLARVYLKDESSRLGLPAFKILGASWAVYREVEERLGGTPEPWSSLEGLARAVTPLRPLELVTATDGNHGRAVARVARWLGLEARIFVPRGTARDRIEAIASEGAAVTEVHGTYDDAVREAASMQGPRRLLVQDNGWPGYETIPRRVVEGYSTMFHEIDAELAARGAGAPDLVLVQVGVGSLAAAVIRHYNAARAVPPTRIVGVEPEDAACALASLVRGRPEEVPGPHRSMMAGLNCGSLSAPAWPSLRDGLDAAIAVEDSHAATAMRLLAERGISSGESGAAGLAGLVALLEGPQASTARRRLRLDERTRVLLLSTEGITDGENYARIVGQP
jgi:diaminopropionate ammonia-lyase